MMASMLSEYVSGEIRIDLEICLNGAGDGVFGNLEVEVCGVGKNLADTGGFLFAVGADGDGAGDGVACVGADGVDFLLAFLDGFDGLEAEDIAGGILRGDGGFQRGGALEREPGRGLHFDADLKTSVEVIAENDGESDFVADGEEARGIVLDEEGLKGANGFFGGADFAVDGGGDGGELPGGDVVGEGKFELGAAFVVGEEFGAPEKSFGKIFAETGSGEWNLGLSLTLTPGPRLKRKSGDAGLDCNHRAHCGLHLDRSCADFDGFHYLADIEDCVEFRDVGGMNRNVGDGVSAEAGCGKLDDVEACRKIAQKVVAVVTRFCREGRCGRGVFGADFRVGDSAVGGVGDSAGNGAA